MPCTKITGNHVHEYLDSENTKSWQKERSCTWQFFGNILFHQAIMYTNSEKINQWCTQKAFMLLYPQTISYTFNFYDGFSNCQDDGSVQPMQQTLDV